MEDHQAMIAKLEGDLSSWSINMQTQAHREGAQLSSRPNLSDDSASEQSVKPTGASESSESLSSRSPSECDTHDEDAPLFELEEDPEDEVVDEAAHDAAQFVRGLQPGCSSYSDRQRCAHGLATALGHSASAATALTKHFGKTTLMRSLLRLIEDAQHKADTLTVDIVLACLTNLSGEESGCGLALVMQEVVAVAALLVSGLDSREAATAQYSTACLHNLKQQPAVLDALRLGGVEARLRQLGRAEGTTGEYARAVLAALLHGSCRTPRGARPGSARPSHSSSAASLVQTVRRVASFGRVPRSRGAATKGVTYGHLTDNDLVSGLLSGV